MPGPSRWAEDGALVRACGRGDATAWEALLVRYRRLMYSIPIAYGLPPEQADDVFQAVAVKLFEHLPKLRREESLAAWVSVTTRRECGAVVHRERRFTPAEDETFEKVGAEPAPLVDALHAVECEHTMAVALEKLGEPCRGLLTALYVEDPTPDYTEIAQRLGRPIGSLGPTRARCLGKLRKIYEELGGGEP